MNGSSMGTLTPRSVEMNHIDRGSTYTSYHASPSSNSYYSNDRFGGYPHNSRGVHENNINLISSKLHRHRLYDGNPEVAPSQIHFSKWSNSGYGHINDRGHRSSSLSPKPAEPAVQLSYRPPTPQVSSNPTTHRGILKGQRTPSEVVGESPRGIFYGQSKGFWDTVDLNSGGEFNDSCNSIAGDSMSRKTVRFADGSPTANSRNVQGSYDGLRDPYNRANGSQAQGIYEWEPDELSNGVRITAAPQKPPRPPKLRPSMRPERRITTDGPSLAQHLRFVSNLDGGGLLAAPLAPLRTTEGPITSMDDNYANYDSIYRNRRYSDSSMGEIEKIDSQKLDALMKPYMTPTSGDISLTNAITHSNPIYRTEVVHNPSNGGTYVGQQKNTVTVNEISTAALPQSAPSSPPLSPSTPQFMYTVKPTPMGSDIDEAFDNINFSEAVDDATLKPNSIPPVTPSSLGSENTLANPPLNVINGDRATVPPRVVTSVRKPSEFHQIPIMTHPQTKRHQPLRVDVNQSPVTKNTPKLNDNSLTSNHQGPPFTDGPRRRGTFEGPHTPIVAAERKTGSLDRDGVWRPNRNINGSVSHAGSSSPIAHGLAYPPSPHLNDLISGSILGTTSHTRPDRQRRQRTTPRFFPFGASFGGYLTGGSGSSSAVEVPIVVLPPSTANTPNSYLAPVTSSTSFSANALRQRPSSPNINAIRRGNVPIWKP